MNRDSCRAFGIASVVVMPLVRGEEVYGVFELLSGRPRAFEERDFVALNRLAEMIQTAVEHSDAARRAEKELGQPAAAVIGLRPGQAEYQLSRSRATMVEAGPPNEPAPEIENHPWRPAAAAAAQPSPQGHRDCRSVSRALVVEPPELADAAQARA